MLAGGRSGGSLINDGVEVLLNAGGGVEVLMNVGGGGSLMNAGGIEVL